MSQQTLLVKYITFTFPNAIKLSEFIPHLLLTTKKTEIEINCLTDVARAAELTHNSALAPCSPCACNLFWFDGLNF